MPDNTNGRLKSGNSGFRKREQTEDPAETPPVDSTKHSVRRYLVKKSLQGPGKNVQKDIRNPFL